MDVCFTPFPNVCICYREVFCLYQISHNFKLKTKKAGSPCVKANACYNKMGRPRNLETGGGRGNAQNTQ